MTDISSDTGTLLMHYNVLLNLYNRLETISNDVFEAIENGLQLGTVQTKLKEKMTVVEAIQSESQKIAALKKHIRFSGNERAEVKRAEEKLTTVVKRVVDRENKSCDLFQKQGVKISRNDVCR